MSAHSRGKIFGPEKLGMSQFGLGDLGEKLFRGGQDWEADPRIAAKTWERNPWALYKTWDGSIHQIPDLKGKLDKVRQKLDSLIPTRNICTSETGTKGTVCWR